MPAPQPIQFGETAKRNFSRQGIKLPVDWQDMGTLYPQAFTPAERAGRSNPPDNLFREPTLNHYHIEAARGLGRSMAQFLDDMCAAISEAIERWMRMASVVSVSINGPIGMVTAGGVAGPALRPMILANAPQQTEMETQYATAVAEAVSDGWTRWQQGLSGVLAYPSFVAAPVPMAPPTPNTPAPLITFGSTGESALAPAALKNAMITALGEEGQHAPALFEALANAFYTHFQMFKASTQVSCVIGTGPVAVMPSGPVTGGFAIPTPGNFK